MWRPAGGDGGSVWPLTTLRRRDTSSSIMHADAFTPKLKAARRRPDDQLGGHRGARRQGGGREVVRRGQGRARRQHDRRRDHQQGVWRRLAGAPAGRRRAASPARARRRRRAAALPGTPLLRVRLAPPCRCLSLQGASAGCAAAAPAGRTDCRAPRQRRARLWTHARTRGAQVFIGRVDADAPDPAGRLPKASASPAEVQARAMPPCPSPPCVLRREIQRAPCPAPQSCPCVHVAT